MEFSKITKWFASVNALSFCLLIGVLFLFSNYQGVIFRVNPENIKETFVYPYELRVIIAHLDSFFFAFATIIIIFQARNEWHKVMYCVFECIMLCLNLTRSFYVGNDFYIALYVSMFSGFTLYFLGKLARAHLSEMEAKEKEAKDRPPVSKEKVNELMQDNEKHAFLKKYAKVVQVLNEGKSISITAKEAKTSESTVKKVKQVLRELATK